MIDIPSVLSSIAEGAITLAGFAAVFRAFAGSRDPDGHSNVRLNIVIEGGLTVAFLCYAPLWLITAGLDQDVAWRGPSILIVLWGVLRITVPTVQIIRNPGPVPALFFLASPTGHSAMIVAALNTTAILPISAASGYLLATILLLSNAGIIFVAQFRAEREA